MKAEFQRIARSDKNTFISDPCKEIEENNRMLKTRDLFKNIRDIKGWAKGKSPPAASPTSPSKTTLANLTTGPSLRPYSKPK